MKSTKIARIIIIIRDNNLMGIMDQYRQIILPCNYFQIKKIKDGFYIATGVSNYNKYFFTIIKSDCSVKLLDNYSYVGSFNTV